MKYLIAQTIVGNAWIKQHNRKNNYTHTYTQLWILITSYNAIILIEIVVRYFVVNCYELFCEFTVFNLDALKAL